MVDSSSGYALYCNADFAAVLYEVFTGLRKDAANGQETIFWDIESYDNFFPALALYGENNELEMHYLVER